MTIRNGVLLALLVALALPAKTTAGTIYNVNRTIGSGLISGTIETNGVLGVLDSANILSWNLTTSDGQQRVSVLSNANSQVGVSGLLLSATPTELQFNFTAGTGYFSMQSLVGQSFSSDFWCLDGTDKFLCTAFGPSTEVLNIADPIGNDTFFVIASRQGNVVIATNAIPLPASLWLLAPALCSLGLARRRAV